MQIDWNTPDGLTLEAVRQLLASPAMMTHATARHQGWDCLYFVRYCGRH